TSSGCGACTRPWSPPAGPRSTGKAGPSVSTVPGCASRSTSGPTRRWACPAGAGPSPWDARGRRNRTMSDDFDQELFEALRERWPRGEIVEAPPPTTLEPLREGDVVPLPAPGSAEHRRASEVGEALLRSGQVAALVVAGGAGTRFGGAVKALVEVVPGQTFLDLKLLDVARTSAPVGRLGPGAGMTHLLPPAAVAAPP